MSNTINVNGRMKTQEMGRGIRNLLLIAGFLVLLIVLVSASTFSVNEHEQAVVARFGSVRKVIVDPEYAAFDSYEKGSQLENAKIIKGKGLFFKVPFIDKVTKYDSWLYTYVSDSEEVNTGDKKQYFMTMFAQWRIYDPGRFFLTQKSISKASLYLDNLIYPEIVQNVNDLSADDFISSKEVLNDALTNAQNNLNKKIKNSGLMIADIQVHRTSLPASNIQSTYNRMIADRAKVAQQLRAEGNEDYEKRVAEADLEARRTIANAIEESERLKGEGDAEALAIYAESYSVDEDFYSFWRSLQALETSLGSNTTLVLDSDHPLWSGLLQWATGDIAE